MKISKTVLGIIAAVAALIVIAVLILQIPGVTPVAPPPTGPTAPPVNMSEAEKKLGPGSAILTATGKAVNGMLNEVVVNVYYIGGRSANDICTEGGIVLKSCEQTLSQGATCETVDFRCSSARAGDLQDIITLGLSASAGKSYIVSLEKYGTYTDVVIK